MNWRREAAMLKAESELNSPILAFCKEHSCFFSEKSEKTLASQANSKTEVEK